MWGLLHCTGCFMSSPEKPYVVENSGLTGTEACVFHSNPPGPGSGFCPVSCNYCSTPLTPAPLFTLCYPRVWGNSGVQLCVPDASLWPQATLDSPGGEDEGRPEPPVTSLISDTCHPHVGHSLSTMRAPLLQVDQRSECIQHTGTQYTTGEVTQGRVARAATPSTDP